MKLYDITEDDSINISIATQDVFAAFDYLKKWESSYTYHDFTEKFKKDKIAMLILPLAAFDYIKDNWHNNIGLAYLPSKDGESYLLPVKQVETIAVPIIEKNPETVIKIYENIFRRNNITRDIEEQVSNIVNTRDRQRYIEMTTQWQSSQILNLLSKLQYIIRKDRERFTAIYDIINKEIPYAVINNKPVEDSLHKLERKLQKLLSY